jgi:hypothetical protein
MTAGSGTHRPDPPTWFRPVDWLVVFGLLEVAAGVVAFLVGEEQFAAWTLILLGMLTLGGAMERARIDRLADEYKSELDDGSPADETGDETPPAHRISS